MPGECLLQHRSYEPRMQRLVIYIKSLLQEDYEVVVTRNGQEGIDKALELIPDIIISDVMMPEKDGFVVCSTLKNDERSSHIPIILLTAKARAEDRLEKLVALRKAPILSDQFLKKGTEFVQERLNDPKLGVTELCKAANLSNMQVTANSKR
jgi:CheY-like chemotaxis protein